MTLWSRFPPRLRRAVAAAVETAAARGCDEVAAEHLLLAVCRDPDSAACFLIERAGVSRAAVLDRLEAAAPSGPRLRQRAARLSPAALHVLDVAAGEADRHGHAHVGTEHVAVALTVADHNGASVVLRDLGFTRERAEAGLRQWVADGLVRRRPKGGRPAVRQWLGRLPRPLRRAVSAPSLGWRLFVGRSLAHPRFVTNPYPLYRWLRDHEPVRRDPLAPVYVVTRYADVATMLKDPRFRKDPFALDRLPAVVREQLGVKAGDPRPGAEVETVSMLFLDPPQHTRVRALFSRAFTPPMIAGLRPRIEQVTDRYLAKVRPAGEMDVIAAVAYPLPVIVIAELLGFPPKDYPLYKKWSDDFAAALGINPTPAQQAASARSRGELRDYFDRLIARPGGPPGDTLVAALLATEHEPGGLSREELFINAALLLAAGHETTTNLIGNGLLALLRHPDQLAAVRDDPSLIESAVDELLRFDSPVQWVSRVVGEPLELGGVPLAAGTILVGGIGAANRDERQFTRPDVLDVRRADNRHLSFGSGIHFCLGATLARMEAQVALTAVLRLPNLRLARQRVRWRKGLIFRALHRLPVRFNPVTDDQPVSSSESRRR